MCWTKLGSNYLKASLKKNGFFLKALSFFKFVLNSLTQHKSLWENKKALVIKLKKAHIKYINN